MIWLNIVWPTFAMVLLTFGVWFTLFVQRVGHMKNNPPQPGDLATGDAARRYFEPAELPSNNLINLFEMPVLFYALVPLLVIAQLATVVQVVLAWLFVALRLAHSIVHIGRGRVPVRFLLYAGSCAVLLAMWIGFAIDMAAAAAHVSAAMGASPAQP